MDTIVEVATVGIGYLYVLSCIIGFGLNLLSLRRAAPRAWVLAPVLLTFGYCGRLQMYLSMLAFTCWLFFEIMSVEEAFPGLARLSALALPLLCLVLLLAGGSAFVAEGRAVLRIEIMAGAWACLILGMARIRRALGEGVVRLGFDSPVLVRSTFSALLLGVADGVVGGSGVLTLLLVPVVVLIHLVRGGAAFGRRDHRQAFQRVAAAVVWLSAAVGIVGLMGYRAHLANSRDERMFTSPGRSQVVGAKLVPEIVTSRASLSRSACKGGAPCGIGPVRHSTSRWPGGANDRVRRS